MTTANLEYMYADGVVISSVQKPKTWDVYFGKEQQSLQRVIDEMQLEIKMLWEENVKLQKRIAECELCPGPGGPTYLKTREEFQQLQDKN